MSAASDMINSGGAKTASFPTVGTTFGGVIVALDEKQATDYMTKEPQFWDAEKTRPKMVPIYCIRTELREDDDDNGERAIYAKAGIFTAIREAGQKDFTHLGRPVTDADLLGATLKVQFHKTEPGKGSDRKVYRAKFIPKPSAAADAWDSAPNEEPPPHEPQREDEGDEGVW